MQTLRLTVGMQQRMNVLAFIRTGYGENHRFVRFLEKTVQGSTDCGGLEGTFRRVEPIEIGAGRNDRHIVRLGGIIETVLQLDFVAGAGNDLLRCGQGLLFGHDAAAHVIAAFDLPGLEPRRQQAPFFHPPQRVTGKDQGNAQLTGDAHPHITGVGIVRVDQVRKTSGFPDMVQDIVGETIQMVP